MGSADITNLLISEEIIRANLVAIFPESILLHQEYTIAAINEQLARVLGYDGQELKGQSISMLMEEAEQNKLQRAMDKGYFDNQMFLLKGKRKETVECKIYGFHLGLISDLNDIIVLKVRPVDEAVLLYNQLEDTRLELDEFIYRAAHDLRGPLASLRGLINLFKMQITSEESSNMLAMMENCAELLDQRLFNLQYLSETVPVKTIDYTLDCALMESTLRTTLEENAPVNKINLQFICEERLVAGVNAQMVIVMLNHLFLYLLSLPRHVNVDITLSLVASPTGLVITIRSEGLNSNYQLRQAVLNRLPSYTSIVTYSNLINFYAAQKIAHRINATLDVDFILESTQQVYLVIPYLTNAPS